MGLLLIISATMDGVASSQPLQDLNPDALAVDPSNSGFIDKLTP